MKKLVMMLMITCCCYSSGVCQTDEAAQLLLNVEKLAQFKQILSDLKKGYEIVSKGYTTIKDLSEGNFTLHRNFLDALMLVSPEVKKYKRIGDIISGQVAMVKESRQHLRLFKDHAGFSLAEVDYVDQVYSKLLKESLRNVEDLTTILTANQLRMSDDDRFRAIDQIYEEMQDKLSFLRSFNTKTKVWAFQRKKEMNDVQGVKNVYGIK